MNSTISSEIVRLATELGLPTGKGRFDTQFGGWVADLTIDDAVLHLWEDRGEFWATIEREGKTAFIVQPTSWVAPTSLERKLERALTIFRNSIKQSASLAPKRPNQSPEPTAMSVTPPAAQEPRQP